MPRECAREGESRGEWGFLENAAMTQGAAVLEELPFLDTPPSERWGPPPALLLNLGWLVTALFHGVQQKACHVMPEAESPTAVQLLFRSLAPSWWEPQAMVPEAQLP